MKQYLLRVLAWLSQGVNCILLGGHHDVTVSARLYLNRERGGKWGFGYRMVNALFFWQADHCRDSWVSDLLWAEEVLSGTHGQTHRLSGSSSLTRKDG